MAVSDKDVMYPLIFTSCGISIILSLIFFVLAIKLIISTEYKSKTSMLFILLMLFMLQIIAYLLSEISYIFYWKFEILYFNQKPFTISIVLPQNLYILFWMIGNGAFHSILILRLYYTFQYTTYRISTCMITFILFIMFGLIIIYGIIMIEISSPKFNISPVITYPLLISFNLIIGISFMYLFLKNLFDVAVKQSVAVDTIFVKKEENGDDNDSTLVEMRSLQMLQLMAKHTVLTIICMSMVQIYWIIEGFQQLYKDDTNTNLWIFKYENYQILLMVRMMLRCFVIFIEILCVYLSFGNNQNLYIKLCSKCHIKCESICKHYAKKRIKYENIQYMIDSNCNH